MRALPAHLSSFIFELSSFFLIFVSQKQFTATTMHLKSGTLLKRGDYRIINSLGRGGFGITYLAEQVSLHRRVCIKEFFPKDYYKRDGDTGALTLSSDGFAEMMGKFKAKFVKEAQTIATLNHANIIPIHDVFEENNTCYYVMEYIEGESLSDIVKRGGAMSERDAVAYIKQVASALEHIHEQQIMHLDVKPGNIMVRSKDNRAILIDFGLSKHYDATSGEATSTTPVGVSHGFAPMEQYRPGGVSTFSPETDIYSLGATLYYLVTGSVPPLAADIADDGLPALPAHLSSGVHRAIEGAMEVQRRRRPHNAAEFLALLGDDRSANVVVRPILNDEATRISPSDERTVLTSTRTYKVGDYYNENGKQGVVFEVTDGGRHGKIVSLDETKAQWCTVEQYNKRIALGLTNKSDGKANTDKIMQRGDSDQYPAFVWCHNKGADWYLPAMDELKAIYNNKSKINSTLAEYGAQLTNGWRWSSTEFEDNPKFWAWLVAMYDGDTNGYDKCLDSSVRAVSAF